MISLFQRYATPLLTGFFLISLVSGIGLFFHIGPSGFHGLHEWLSMVLILPFVLHLWRNWRPMLGYFRRAPIWLALALSVAAATVFLLPSGGDSAGRAGGPPQFQLAHLMLSHSASEVAPSLGLTAQTLGQRLRAAGFTLASPDQSLTEIARQSGKTEADLATALTTDPTPAPTGA